ncbi:MAG: hypothetical protein CL955_10945 [Erythrobacteraceae bacterium]|nr:hypothetical protein [Erythrobacteraceae bacterium]|tara:strand:+ start:409 stop:1647 length:1239 start_codon:yes stop_codon:yes gene_type:complete
MVAITEWRIGAAKIQESLHTQHQLREVIHAESHARPPMPLQDDECEIWHWVLSPKQQSSRDWPEPLNPNAHHQVIELANGILRFERHTEFASLTHFGAGPPDQDARALISQCPGVQLAGARILVTPNKVPNGFFSGSRLFGGEAMFDSVTVTTDFQLGKHELIDYAVCGQFHDAFARGRIVKRLIDLETYRSASLLGLPLVRELGSELSKLEDRAADVSRTLDNEDQDLNETIHQLADILKAVSAIRTTASFRIAASNAYYGLVNDRLESLKEIPIGQRQTLRGFIQHRLDPGMKTIRAFERRVNDLASSVSEGLALVRTQLDHTAQQQSQKLLASMELRASQQLHLAQAVEGLSVAAITYYAVGLLTYVLKGLPFTVLYKDAVVAFSVLPIAILAFLLTRRTKKRVLADAS